MKNVIAPRLALATLLLTSCLPVDTRPPPGRALVTVSSDDTGAGFTTADGWLVRYDRQLVSIGNFGVAEGPCEPYATSHYVRVLDLSRSEPQKLVEMYALGTCPFIVEVREPTPEVVLGAGVVEQDVAFLRTRGSDPYVRERGIGLHLAGIATRGDQTIRFAWSIRENLVYGAGSCGEISFVTDGQTTLDLHFDTAALFSDPALTGGVVEPRFDRFAAADADADGEVTLDELDAVPFEGGETGTLGGWFYKKTAVELVSVGGTRCIPGKFIED
jgi:hypothetical protein